jgi:hypothetical protein
MPGLICQTVPLLHEVHAQHALDTNRRAAWLAAFRLMRLDDFDQPCPWHDLLHLAKKYFAPGYLLLAFVFSKCETDLGWGFERHLEITSDTLTRLACSVNKSAFA